MKKFMLMILLLMISILIYTENSPYIYGYLTEFITYNIEDTLFGNSTYLRIKSDYEVENNVGFHMELSYLYSFGEQNYYALFDDWGINTNQIMYPYNNFMEGFNFDHFYGSVNFDAFDFRFGKLPIGWGTGYVFNPTSRTYIMPFMNFVAEETPGTYALMPSISINDLNSINMYFAFQDKTHKKNAFIDDGKIDNIPFGIKLYSIIGAYDFSFSFIREIVYNNSYIKKYYSGFDFAGAIWNFGIYGELVYNIANDSIDDFDLSDDDFMEQAEFCLGFDYESPCEIELRSEYYHQGIGEKDSVNYDIINLLDGSNILLAENYLFSYLTRVFANYHKIIIGGFFNIDDKSIIIFPEYDYDVYSNVIMSIGALLYTGDSGSEFNGEFNLFNIIPIDLTHNTIYLKCKLSF